MANAITQVSDSSGIRVLVVDDHPVVRDGVASQLKSCTEVSVVGLAASGCEAVAMCGQYRPDVVLLDLRLPDMAAHDVVDRALAVSPRSKHIVFTAFPEHAEVAPALAAGACGILVKEISGADLCTAVREVATTGKLTLSGPQPTTNMITPREYDMIRLVGAGYTNSEIGYELNLSVNTVKDYIRNVMQKLAARNRAQLITNARSRGFL
ncbi:response regulator transcription factor [Rhodococcus erythropolis]|uniref:response regulator transcription factor n=1 Tax=Rhodococcus erythropolis TaxID=1833 RepID=UPI0029490524|nr:response regulator transcription factor [Rhodococcus erythropolis]MDV6212791.1 response regulator transcription factor [Rhodococcus erythropolis]